MSEAGPPSGWDIVFLEPMSKYKLGLTGQLNGGW
jgi:hypothetical protein